MLKYVIKMLGYGHQIVPVMGEPKVERKSNFVIATPNAEYTRLTQQSIMLDINPHAPVSDFLPFTTSEYIIGAFNNFVMGKPISDKVLSVRPYAKFHTKTLIEIPNGVMYPLQFLNVIQDSVKYLNSLSSIKAYFILPHEDPFLSSTTSNNFTKTAIGATIPLDVLDAINVIKLVCDIDVGLYKGHYFTYTFNKQGDNWVLANINAVKPWVVISPYELFMHAWTLMLHDIDCICNRSLKVINGNRVDVNHHYNLRTKYDISAALAEIAAIIDYEVVDDGNNYKLAQTVIKDNNLNLSSHITDFRAATEILRQEGSIGRIQL